MKKLSPEQAAKRTTFLRLNILLGFIAFIISVLLTITGEYATLAERKEADQIYNLISIGSLLYVAIIWFSCVFSRPFWKSDPDKS